MNEATTVPRAEYDVHIIDQTTGEEAIYHSKENWYFVDIYDLTIMDSEWWWTEGNGGCDCNRWDFFRRARGISEEEINNTRPASCTEDRFFIPFISVADGHRVLIDRNLWCLDCNENYKVDTASIYDATYIQYCPKCGKVLKKI